MEAALTIKSKALEVNIADYHVDVTIDPRFSVLLDTMSQYYGIMEGVNVFLKELSHPYKNWQFIVSEARTYSLDYFHLIKAHPDGAEAAERFIEIFSDALLADIPLSTQMDAVDNLLLYLQKLIKDSGTALERFLPVLSHAFSRIRAYPVTTFFLFVKSYYQIKRLAEIFIENTAGKDVDCTELNHLLLRYFRETYRYWLSEKDPQAWFESEVDILDTGVDWKAFFSDISHHQIKQLQNQLESLAETSDMASRETAADLCSRTGYSQIVEIYRKIPQKLLDAGSKNNRGNQWKVIFLFFIMNISGLSIIHEEVLRDVNRTLGSLIEQETHFYISSLIEKTFSISIE